MEIDTNTQKDEQLKIKISDIDIFYLSYDEPNYEEHWADIKSKIP